MENKINNIKQDKTNKRQHKRTVQAKYDKYAQESFEIKNGRPKTRHQKIDFHVIKLQNNLFINLYGFHCKLIFSFKRRVRCLSSVGRSH